MIVDIFAHWKRQLAERRAERLAKAQSDAIDRLLQESKDRKQLQRHDILLIGSFRSLFPSRRLPVD
jgi:hypothetical protein